MELKATLLTLACLASLPLTTAETVLGLYIVHRHGDRTPKSLPPTVLTPLGASQVLSSGAYYRDRYLGASSPFRVRNLSPDLAIGSQLSVTAPIDTVLQNSATVFLQGLYPPAGDASKETLANGTVTEAPFSGYQYIPVNAATTAATGSNAEDSGWLQGASGCGKAIVSSNSYFASAEYAATLASTSSFYQGLEPVINGTFSAAQTTFKNAYTIFDLVNVATIHNHTIPAADLLTPETLHQLQTRADQHEWGLAYNASDPIRGIAGSVLAAQIVQALGTTVAALARPRALKATVQFGAYGTFMSFFGHAALPAAAADFLGIVDYASSMVFELVTNSTAVPPAEGELAVRFLFANGSAAEGGGLREFPLFGGRETVLPWAAFVAGMNKFAVGDTLDWCRACGNTTGICAAAAGAEDGSTPSVAAAGGGSGMSLAVAGVIGALVALVVILGVEGAVMAVVGLRVVKKGVAARGKAAEATNP